MNDNDKTKEEPVEGEILKKDARLQESEERFQTIFERTIYGISHKTSRPCYEEGEECVVRHRLEELRDALNELLIEERII